MILSKNKFEIDVEFTMKSKETVSQGFGIFLTNRNPIIIMNFQKMICFLDLHHNIKALGYSCIK